MKIRRAEKRPQGSSPSGRRRLWTRHWSLFLLLPSLFAGRDVVFAQQPQVLNDPVDISQDFQRFEHVYFVGSKVTNFNPASGQGTLQWDRYLRSTTLSFNKIDSVLSKGQATEF
ncbi:MAG TPA: hypothetical protein VF766_12530, partial [Pyrinomonadaceae bacterium]